MKRFARRPPADTSDPEASDASTIASTARQPCINFGIAFPSLLTGAFLGGIDRSNAEHLVPALHKAYLLLGAVTVGSAATFLLLKRDDGANVSGHGKPPVQDGAEPVSIRQPG